MKYRKYQETPPLAFLGALFVVFVVMPAIAWIVHVVTCINAQEWLFMIAGAIAFPVGVIHGTGVILGVW